MMLQGQVHHGTYADLWDYLGVNLHNNLEFTNSVGGRKVTNL